MVFHKPESKDFLTGTNYWGKMDIMDRQAGWKLRMANPEGTISHGTENRKMDPGSPAFTSYTFFPLFPGSSDMIILIIKLSGPMGRSE